jgi:hypothetical protein
MKRRTRIYYTDKQKAFMWERWKQGDSMTDIAPLFNRHHATGSLNPQKCKAKYK